MTQDYGNFNNLLKKFCKILKFYRIGRKLYGYSRTLFRTFFHTDFTIVQCDDFPHQRKSQAYATVFPASRFIHTKEGLKNTFSVLFGDAVAGIRNRNNKLIVTVPSKRL